MSRRYVAAIDQGTTSTRCLIFDDCANIVAIAQHEHAQHFPRPGWVEHDAAEIWQKTAQCIREVTTAIGETANSIAAVGVTNQRETVVIWDRRSGQPLTPAIVWQDTRTAKACKRLAGEISNNHIRELTGLPWSTYFSGPKIAWALEHVDGLRNAASDGRLLCGTIESWIIWNLTGGPKGGVHVTDVTNASRTQLMNLRTLAWEGDILDLLEIPRTILPRIVPCSASGGLGQTRPDGPFARQIPVCGAIGDQQAALVGQCCFVTGHAKNTYGTGCFLLQNTGSTPVLSNAGLLSTVAYQFDGGPAVYALEGSVAVAGALVHWLRDNLGLIRTSADVERLAREVDTNGGVYIVPAFSGLFAPHWRPDARGIIAGLTRFATKAHIARAALEAVCLQTRDVVEAMRKDSGLMLRELKVDGGMTSNELLMQLQADVLDVATVRPRVSETTALGAAFVAGLGAGIWNNVEDLCRTWQADHTWTPRMTDKERRVLLAGWSRALEHSLNWIDASESA